MRKHFLCLLMALFAMTATLKAQQIVFTDGFESGNLSKWTQENVVGNTAWAVESENLAYPETAVQGTHRAYLRNTTGETQGYVTRLVSPVMRLDTVYQPLLRFYYANPKWTADRDTLRVLYRTGAKAKWNELATYSDAKKDWTFVEMLLPEYNETYQIAFEGKDNLGRGIVLDSVVIRSTPECTVPRDFSITPLGAGKAKLSWTASWDANQFEVIVLKQKIDPDTIDNVPDSVIDVHVFVDGAQQNLEMQLESGEYYYAYVRSLCDAENSYWNSNDPKQDGPYYFRVKATKFVPYSYDFNYPYNSGYIMRNLEWTWKSNINKAAFINTATAEADWYKYSNDSTTAVIFAENNSMTTPIPARKYSYLATPAIADSMSTDFALNKCQVRFWSTVYQNTGRLYAHSIIVGAMTDPEDFTTFEPVDTVSVWGTSTYVENIVDMSSYKGEGVYVAFLSQFDKQNFFCIDNMTVEYKPAVQKVTKISVNPRDTYADITWEGSAPKYSVLVTDKEYADPTKVTPDHIIDLAEVSTNSYKCEGLEADHSWNRPYYVYVQAIEGSKKADWSYRYPFVTIASKKEMPYTLKMDQEAGDYYNIQEVRYPMNVGIFSNDPEYPHLTTTNAYNGGSCLYLTKDAGNDSWITLPMIDSIPAAQIKFYLSGNTTPLQAHATVGVMSNPMDINTFEPVSEFNIGTEGYTICYTNFANYPKKDGVIAIVWSDVEEGGKKQTINYIDNIIIEEIQKCLPPVNVVVDAQPDTITLSWDVSEASKWEFILATDELSENQLTKLTMDSISRLDNVLMVDTLEWAEPAKKPTFGMGGLTQNTAYLVYLRSLCSEDEKAWWSTVAFQTPCITKFPIPFFDDFEDYESVNLTIGCWVVRNQGASTYPKVSSLTVGESKKAVNLYTTSTGNSYMAIPGVNGDLSKMMVSFDVRSWGSTVSDAIKAYLIVGQMSDYEDPSTFIGLDTFYLKGTAEYQPVKMNLEDYNLVYDNIVFTSGLPDFASRLPAGISFTTSDVALDNVAVKPNTCIEAWDIQATDIQMTSIDIAWKGKSDGDQWNIKVMQGKAHIKSETVTGKKYHIGDLSPMMNYTFYIQSACDTTWTEKNFRTLCGKLDPSKANKEDFESITDATTSYKATSQISCWTTGNLNPGTATTYLPFVYKGNASSGNNSYRMYGTATYGPAYVVTPEIDCTSMADLAVTFNMYATTSYWWICGVMSNPDSLNTFIALDSIKGTGASAQYTYDLSEYADKIPATAKYFAWRTRYGATDYAYLDDVSIIKVTCPLPKPHCSQVKAARATISSGLRGDNEWIALVTTKKFDDMELATMNVDSMAHVDTTVVYYDTLDVKSQIVTGLKEQTDYYVAVAAVCDDGISAWKLTSFTTPCKAVTPEALGTITFSKSDGYVSGSTASRYLPCWTIGNKHVTSATSTYIPYIYTTSTYLHGKDSVLCLYTYNSTSANNDGAYAIMPELDIDDINDYQINFWTRSNSTASYNNRIIVGIISDPSDLNTFTAVDTLTVSKTAFEPVTVTFDGYEGDYQGKKGKNIMFLNEFGYMGYTQIFVASISVEKIPACPPVTKFVIDSVAEDAAVVSWKQYSDKYRMLFSDEPVADTAKATYKWLIDSIVTNTSHIMLKNLKANSHYYVYAQNICSATDTSAISQAYAHIHTNCPETKGFPVPYKENFESFTTGAYDGGVGCWPANNFATGTGYPKVLKPTSGAQDGNMLELWSTSTTQRNVIMLPKVQGNLSDYVLSFDTRPYSGTATGKAILYVGTMGDISDSATFKPFYKLNIEDGTKFTHVDLVLADYSLVYDRLALSSGLSETLEAASDIYFDNFRLGPPPSCYAPEIEAGQTTYYTAEVLITPAKAENNLWQLAVVPDSIYTQDGFEVETYLAGSTVRIVNADSVNFVVSGLTPGTLYQIFARTVCDGEDEPSEWTGKPMPIRTKFYYTDSYFFGFEKEEGWERSPLSTSDSYIMHPAVEAGYVQLGSAITSYSYMPHALITTSSGYNYGYGPSDWSMGKTGIRWNATTSYYGQYVIMPALNEAKDRSLEFKFRNGYSYISSNKYIVSTSYNVSIEVGTVDKFKGMETYQKLATITMNAYPSSSEATEANDWLWRSYTLDLDSATIADKQIVFYQAQKPTASCYPYIDNVTMGAPKGFGMVTLSGFDVQPTKATVNWVNTGGPWNLYVLKTDGDTLARYENLMGVTSQEITGLTPKSTYTVILSAANAPKVTKYTVSDSRTLRTPCLPIAPDANGEFVWDFNDASEWEQSDVLVEGNANNKYYFKPECFTIGTTYGGSQTTSTVYYNWLIQRKGYTATGAPITQGTSPTSTARYEYGRNDSPTLRIYSSSSYMTPYIVLPQLQCDLDTMMIEFWGRCLWNYANDYGTATSQNKVYSNTYLGTSYSRKMVVGTLTNPYDFSTLEVIDTVTYAYTQAQITSSTLVTSDPTGNRYWQKFQVPLKGGSSKYIVLFQPAYGLFFLDDLSVKPVGDNLFAPKGANTDSVKATSAYVSCQVNHPTLPTIFVLTTQTGDSIITSDTIQASGQSHVTHVFTEGVNANSAYQWYAYQTNGTVNTSNTENLAFYTECVEITPDYTTSFNPKEGWRILPAQTSVTYKQNLCWVYENAKSSAVSTYTYNYVNASTNYAHSEETDDGAVRLYAYSTTYQTYAAMPAMDVAAYDTLQVNFWIRPAYVTASTGKVSTQYTLGTAAATKEYYYSKAVIVGTMTDPNDAATFVPIDTVNYIGTLSTTDVATEANDYLFQQKKIALRGATGPYVAFMATLYAKGADEAHKSTYDYIWMDDVSFSLRQDCKDPMDLEVKDRTATSATLAWEGGADKYFLQVSTDATYPDTTLLFNDTVYDANTFTVTGLKEHTEYVWHVKAICGGDLGESDYSQNSSFTTARVPFFGESFVDANIDADWAYGTNPALLVLDSTNVEITGSNSTSYGFHRVTTKYGIDAEAHYCVPFYSSSTTTTYDYDYYWMISPVITLDATSIAHMTVDLALTGSSTTTPNATIPGAANVADDYAFAIAVSDDGGKTWKKENILALWNNAIPGAMPLLSLPLNAQTYHFDLSKYAGKTIRVAFYREAQTYLSNTCAVHMGNFRIINYADVQAVAESCQYEDVDQLGFYIDGDKAEAGNKKYMRMALASDASALKGAVDTVYTLDVTYNAVPETVIEDTICAGDTYSSYDFSGKTETGVYSRKSSPANACDSITRLHLYVRPKLETNLEYTICQGQTLSFTDKFIGQTLNRTGVYFDTVPASTGCDSALILALTVVDAFTSEFSAAICEGKGSYYWEAVGKSYTVAGDYTEKIITATGCDSIVTLHLSYNKNYNETINVTICEGGDYEFGGTKITAAGTYVHTFESVLGCDSTVTLNLAISDMYRDTIKAEIYEGEVYKFYDVEYDETGVYDVMRPGQGTDCDSLRVLVLTVSEKPDEAIDNVNTSELTLRPNILNAGETVRADYHFTKADLANLKVEVYDVVGRNVESKMYDHQPIIIDAFPISGVYTVRITTGTGLNLVGRVVVR